MRASSVAATAGLLLLVSANATAQGPVARDCDYRVVTRLAWQDLDARSRSLHPDSAFVRMGERMAENRWLFLADSIASEVEGEPGIPTEQKRIFLDQLAALRSELRAVEASGDPVGFRNRGEGVTQVRFRISPAPGGGYELFLDGPATIDLSTIPDSVARRAICWRALTLSRMLSAYGGPGRALAVTALEASEKRWDNFTERGYSQFPWELLINSKRFRSTEQNPPANQVVFLHPALSLELVAPSLDSLEHLRRLDAISIEPLGFLWYNRSRSMYYGVSSLVSLPSDGLIGFGAMAHIGTYGKVGVILWRADDASGSDSRSIVVSADLYQFLTGVPQKLREAKSEALQEVVRQRLLTVTEPR